MRKIALGWVSPPPEPLGNGMYSRDVSGAEGWRVSTVVMHRSSPGDRFPQTSVLERITHITHWVK